MSFTFFEKERASETTALIKTNDPASEPIKKKLKVCVYGEAGVGKTALINRLSNNHFDANETKLTSKRPTKQIKSEITDITLETVFEFSEKTNKKNAKPGFHKVEKKVSPADDSLHSAQDDKHEIIDVILLLVDLSKSYSSADIASTKKWKKQMEKQCGSKTTIWLIGVKADLANESTTKEKNTKRLTELLAHSVSAKDGSGINEMLIDLNNCVFIGELFSDTLNNAGF